MDKKDAKIELTEAQKAELLKQLDDSTLAQVSGGGRAIAQQSLANTTVLVGAMT
jgi:bacteriocin-like protein